MVRFWVGTSIQRPRTIPAYYKFHQSLCACHRIPRHSHEDSDRSRGWKVPAPAQLQPGRLSGGASRKGQQQKGKWTSVSAEALQVAEYSSGCTRAWESNFGKDAFPVVTSVTHIFLLGSKHQMTLLCLLAVCGIYT